MPDLMTRTLPPAEHETQDVSLRFVIRLLAFIGAMLLFMLSLAFWIFHGQLADQRFARPIPDFPAPRLQPSPRADMEAFRAEQLRALDSAGWRDRKAGTTHIPIDQAMRAIAAEGIPGWPTGNLNVSLGDRR